MADIKRITPEEVLKSITANELTPYQEEFVTLDSGKNCVCGLSAIVIAKGNTFGFIRSLDNSEAFVMDTLIKDGFTQEYLVGFVKGFDFMESRFATTDENYAVGIKDGIAAWEAVKHLALPDDE